MCLELRFLKIRHQRGSEFDLRPSLMKPPNYLSLQRCYNVIYNFWYYFISNTIIYLSPLDCFCGCLALGALLMCSLNCACFHANDSQGMHIRVIRVRVSCNSIIWGFLFKVLTVNTWTITTWFMYWLMLKSYLNF